MSNPHDWIPYGTLHDQLECRRCGEGIYDQYKYHTNEDCPLHDTSVPAVPRIRRRRRKAMTALLIAALRRMGL